MDRDERWYEQPQVILAAFAFDETGECALDEAARVAERDPRTELHAVHVLSPRDSDPDLLSIDIRLTGVPDEIKRCVDSLWTRYACDVTVHVRTGRAAKEILSTAAEIDADLIVVGTHQRVGLGKLVLGSVAESVLHYARCPVLVALPKAHPEESYDLEVEHYVERHSYRDRHRSSRPPK